MLTKTKMAAIVFGAVLSTATAAGAVTMTGGFDWQPWTQSHPRETFCKLQLTSLQQDNPGQRLRIGLRNVSDTRLQVGLQVFVDKNGRRYETSAFYDNINVGETRQADSTRSVATSISGSRITVVVTHCQERF